MNERRKLTEGQKPPVLVQIEDQAQVVEQPRHQPILTPPEELLGSHQDLHIFMDPPKQVPSPFFPG